MAAHRGGLARESQSGEAATGWWYGAARTGVWLSVQKARLAVVFPVTDGLCSMGGCGFAWW